MSNGPTNYFILVYDLATRRVQVEEWGNKDVAAAAAYSKREQEFQDRDEIEVVMVGADSLATVKRTHSHYFVESTDELFEQLSRELLARSSS